VNFLQFLHLWNIYLDFAIDHGLWMNGDEMQFGLPMLFGELDRVLKRVLGTLRSIERYQYFMHNIWSFSSERASTGLNSDILVPNAIAIGPNVSVQDSLINCSSHCRTSIMPLGHKSFTVVQPISRQLIYSCTVILVFHGQATAPASPVTTKPSVLGILAADRLSGAIARPLPYEQNEKAKEIHSKHLHAQLVSRRFGAALLERARLHFRCFVP
jgi:hypothetical protein